MSEAGKTYIEFVGLPGSGKSTLMQAFKDEAARRGKAVLVADEVRLLEGRSVAYGLSPFVTFPVKALSILLFWLRHKALFYDTSIGSRELGRRIRFVSLKRLLRDRFIFLKYDFDYFLCEGVLHPITFFNHHAPHALIKRVSRFLPGKKRLIVFLDTPAEAAFRRMRSRDKRNNIYAFVEERGEAWGLAYYEETYAAIERVFGYAEDADIGTLRLDGTLSVQANAETLLERVTQERL